MYNVEKLEQEWIHYRRKKILYPLGATIGLGLIVFSLFLYMSSRTPIVDQNKTKPTNMSMQEGLRNHTNEIAKETEAKLDTLAVEVPSLSPEKRQERPNVGQIIFQEEGTKAQRTTRKRKNLLIQVTERGGKDIARDIENRFEFAKDTSDSLFLAKYYYDKSNYHKAEKWALETNKLDNKIEESWLIFAKSLARQGKRIESLKVLKAFLEQGGSTKARVLMDKIRRGKQF